MKRPASGWRNRFPWNSFSATERSEVVSIFVATLLGFTILEPVHLLFINLVTDCFPALALGMEKAEKDIMHRPPRPSDEGIFAEGLGFDVIYQGLTVSLLTISSYFIGHFMESGVWEVAMSPDGMTMAFLTMSLAEIFHSINMRSRHGSIFSIGHKNTSLTFAALGSLAATLAVVYVPFLRNAFSLEHISLYEFTVSAVLAFLIIPIVECVKAVQRKAVQRKKDK